MTNGEYSPDEYVLDSSGKPIRDRYGRPVRKRGATGSASHRSADASRSDAAGRSRQYFPQDSNTSDAGGRRRRATNYEAGGAQEAAQRPRQYIPPEYQQREYQRDYQNRDYQGQRRQYQDRPYQDQQYSGQQYSGQQYQGQRYQSPEQRPGQQYGQYRTADSSRQQPGRPQPGRQQGQPGRGQGRYQGRPGAPGAAMHASQLGSAAQTKQRRKRRGGCLKWLGFILLALIVLSLVTVLWMDSKLNRTDASPATTIANTSGTNWLLVGSDSRDGYTDEDAERLGTGGDLGSMRTDTIMILHIPRGGNATLVSLPRDSYVSIPGYGQDKINAAYAYGGAPLLVETVEQATGLHIDRYAEIGMGGLANVVDAIGGIEVCPEEAIDDPLANLNIQAGCQEIDGVTALGYVRTRATANGDLDRVERQREFLNALAKKAASPGTILNPVRALRLVNAVPSSLTVGEGDHIWNLARIPLAMVNGLETTTVPISGFGSYDVGSVVLWDETEAQALFDSLR